MTAVGGNIQKKLRQSRTCSSGFTMVELMVTIGIIMVLAALSTPFLRTLYLQQQFNGAVQEMLASIRQARLAAVENNESVVVTINTGAGGTIQAFVDDGGSSLDGDLNGVPDQAQNWIWNQGDNEQLIFNSTVPQGVNITSAKFPNAAVFEPFFRFDNRGFPMSKAGNALTDGIITMSSPPLGRTRQIDLFRSGHSRIQ